MDMKKGRADEGEWLVFPKEGGDFSPLLAYLSCAQIPPTPFYIIKLQVVFVIWENGVEFKQRSSPRAVCGGGKKVEGSYTFPQSNRCT